MATTFSVREAELIAQELRVLRVLIEHRGAQLEELVGRLQALEEWRASTRAEGGA